MNVGETWRDWKIEELLGRGSFGQVYKAVRREMGHSYYSALKVINIPNSKSEYYALKNQGMTDAEIDAYFRDTAQYFSSELKMMDEFKGHSNIVSYETHLIEKNPDGIGWTIYIQMELLTPFYKYAQNTPLNEADVIKLGVDICTALDMFGKNKIVHRSVTPSNIFVSNLGGYKLGEFEIDPQRGKSNLGFSKYRAPDVYLGKAQDSRSDIYSLGIVMYSLLNCMCVPFLPLPPQQISANDMQQAINKRNNGEIIPPPCSGSSELAAVVLRACAFEPRDRYQSASEMKKALLGISKKRITADYSAESAVSKRKKKKLIIAASAAALSLIILSVAVTGIILSGQNRGAVVDTVERNSLVMAGKTDDIKNWSYLKSIKAVEKGFAGLKNDGTVITSGSSKCLNGVGNWHNIKEIAAGENYLIGLMENGKVVESSSGENLSVYGWEDVETISAGYDHCVGLKKDGTVVAAGSNEKGQCSVEGWTDIVAVAAGARFTVGLKKDGTVVAAGNNDNSQLDVGSWSNITAVSAGRYHTVGLKSDGTVIFVGDNSANQGDISGWTDITAIAAGNDHTVGLKKDGTVVAAGNNYSGQCSVDDWNNIKAIDAGANITVGTK